MSEEYTSETLEQVMDPAPKAEVIKDANGSEYALLPPGWSVGDIRTEPTLAPHRHNGTRRFLNLESLVDYIGGFSLVSAKAYASKDHICVVLNDASKDSPGFGDFMAEFKPKHTPEWKAWMDGNEKSFSQTAFANHLEDNLEDIVEPTGSAMFEIVTTLQSQTTGHFKSAIDLANGGRQLVWESKEEAKAGKDGQLEVPRQFKVNLQMCQGIPAKATLTANLRFRKKDGNLTFYYKLIRPERATEAVMEGFYKQFEELVPDVPLLLV